MTHNVSIFVSYASVVALAAGALLGGIQPLDAAQATASIGATIQNNGGGVITPPPPLPADNSSDSASDDSSGSASGGDIVSPPDDPTSNLGFNPPAPVDTATDAANADASGDGSTSVSDGPNELPRASRPFARSSASNISIGTRTSVGVSGRPNQTYSVILPGQTIYSKDGNIISLNDFQHNAGSTPSLDGRGGDIFSIGASVVTVPIGEESFIRTGPGNNTDQAATTGGTTAEANPIPSIQDIIAGTDGLSTNENQRRQILAAAFTARSPFVNIVVSYN